MAAVAPVAKALPRTPGCTHFVPIVDDLHDDQSAQTLLHKEQTPWAPLTPRSSRA